MAHHEISIYDLATGMFAGVYGGATQALLELQVGAGQGFVAGAYERSTWYVVDGTPTLLGFSNVEERELARRVEHLALLE